MSADLGSIKSEIEMMTYSESEKEEERIDEATDNGKQL